MKKTYIEPKNTVVALKTAKILCTSGPTVDNTPGAQAKSSEYLPGDLGGLIEEGTHGLARESLNAWDEW